MNAKRNGLVALALVLAVIGLPAAAHHSVAGVFDVSRTLKLTGTVSRVDWVNPHTSVYLDVKESGGAVTTWRLECLPVAMMRKGGLSKQQLLGDGQTVTVAAHPARNGTPALGYLLDMSFGDGRHLQFSPDPNDKSAANQ
jgi:hypothetical protein